MNRLIKLFYLCLFAILTTYSIGYGQSQFSLTTNFFLVGKKWAPSPKMSWGINYRIKKTSFGLMYDIVAVGNNEGANYYSSGLSILGKRNVEITRNFEFYLGVWGSFVQYAFAYGVLVPYNEDPKFYFLTHTPFSSSNYNFFQYRIIPLSLDFGIEKYLCNYFSVSFGIGPGFIFTHLIETKIPTNKELRRGWTTNTDLRMNAGVKSVLFQGKGKK